jgi:arginine-tRNA-protein transferase
VNRIALHKEPPSPCEYLPSESAQLLYGFAPDLRPSHYIELLKAGWRRMGPVVFRPDCPSCRQCLSLRVPVESFRPSRTQRRIWKSNAREVVLRIGSPSLTPERLQLYDSFHAHGHQTKGWPDRSHESQGESGSGLDLMLRDAFPMEEWSYWLGDRLVGIGYVDALTVGLSAIYFFHDPREHKRSLGSLNILHLIDAAGHRGLPHVYLGYYVKGCRSLEYKARFRPNEVFRDAAWDAFTAW